MNRVQFGEGACEKTRRYLDSYVSNELLVETNHEVLRHLEGCPACAAELETRQRLRTQLKGAVKRQAVPAELPARVRAKLIKRSHTWLDAGWSRWAVAMAACLVIGAVLWTGYPRAKLPGIGDRPAQDVFIQRISAAMSAVLKVGLGDHVHCAVFRKYPQDPPTVEQMEEKLGPSYQGLLPLVRAAVPEGYRVIMAHQCGYAGRKFVHLTLRREGELLSLLIARKEKGESLAGLAPAAQASGIPVYQSAAERYQVAGFEAGDFLAFVVSDLKSKTNLQIAANLAPGVHEFLRKTV